MAVFSVPKIENFTMMSNHHLRNKKLSLKAVGLMSKILSLPDEWDYSLKGLAKLNADGIDGVRSAVQELEDAGYIIRRQRRDKNGRMAQSEYLVFEIPELSKPALDSPSSEKPIPVKPATDVPTSGNPMQINTNQVITHQENTHLNNTPSINHSGTGRRNDGTDWMDERERYREIIEENIEYTDVDIVAELQKLVDSHVDSYKEDFDIDKSIIRRAAESQNPEDKTLMWVCRPHGTHCLNENQVFIQGTRDHNTFRFYAEQTYDECVARVIVPKTVTRGKVFGDVFEINYREQAANVAQNSVAPDHDRLTFADGFVLDAPCRSSFDAAMALVGEHGGVKTHQTLPKDADALAEVLTKQKSRRDRLPEAERTEALSPLPVAELRKYEAVKKTHPDALVCFAQNGYFELYGKDAEKAAPLLGTKLLEKKVRGKPSIQQKAAADTKIAENDEAIQRSHERMKELDSEASCSDDKLDAVCDQYADCKALTYELTHAFISAVYIYDLDNIEIVWKFKDFLNTSEGEAK